MEKAESVRLFDEIFGEGWWDNEKADEWDKLTLEQNFHHQIDRQNTQIEQIEPNSTDQNPPLTESDHLGQIEHNSTDQNPPLTESDHSDNATNGEEHNEIKQKITSNENIAEDEQKLSRSKIYEWKKEFGISRKPGSNYSDDEKLRIAKKLMQMKSERSGGKMNLAKPNHKITITNKRN
uniref:Uncharacterized protein n=1 Tax=Globodera rostochiensis TaxID=31243 RepID=A0A914IEY3_GLORO